MTAPSREKFLSQLTVVHANEIPEDEDCPICSNPLHDIVARDPEALVRTPCRHIFCASCLAEWLKEHKSCPNCRAVLFTPTDFEELWWQMTGAVQGMPRGLRRVEPRVFVGGGLRRSARIHRQARVSYED